MHATTRPLITTGIAIVGVSLIAVTPATSALLDGQAHSVQLTSVWDDLTGPYTQLFEHTWDNLERIGTQWIADPTPLLDQVFANQAGYWGGVPDALQTFNIGNVFNAFEVGARGMVGHFLDAYAALTDWSLDLDTSDLLSGVSLPATGDLLGALLGGTSAVHSLIQGLLDNIGNIHLNMGIPLALAVDSLGAPFFGLLQAVTSGSQFFDQLGAGDWSSAFTTLFTSPAWIGDEYLNHDGLSISELFTSLNALGIDVGSLDQLLGSLNTDLGTIDFPLNATDLGAPSWAAGLSTVAHISLGDISNLNLDGNLPLGGLLASLGHASADGSLDWSGLSVTFDAVDGELCKWGICVPVHFTPSPINVAGDTFTFGTQVDGTPTGGFIPGLFWADHQLAEVISQPGTRDWDGLWAYTQELFAPDRFVNQIGDLFAQFGLGSVDTSFLDPTTWLDWLDPAVWLDLSWLAPMVDPMLEMFDPTWTVEAVPDLLSGLLGF